MNDWYDNCPICTIFDQRNYWTAWKNWGGNRNPANWVHSGFHHEIFENMHGDHPEFNQLFGHANNIGLNSLWLYVGAPDGVPGNIPDFCNEAWKNGWLKKYVQDVVFTWRCVLPDPCDCNPACFPNNYYLDNISYGSIIEVFP